MKLATLELIHCPRTKTKLKIQSIDEQVDDEIITGTLSNESGDRYRIENGIADLTTEKELVGDAIFARNYYKTIASTYDSNVDITFKLYNENEDVSRNYMINLLDLKPNSRVLEISAGTGKDSELILKRLSVQGELVCLDISPDMLIYAKQKLSKYENYTDAVSGSACNLPFEDNTFDALYCFAGVGHFPSIKDGLREMSRVVRPGGKVVFCEKNVPLWLRNTTYGKILINNNPMFALEAPLSFIPENARNVGIRWIIGNVHYVVDYTVGIGEPIGNFDLELPGERGGTFNSRYYGQLEGVTSETKQLAIKAAKKSGKSLHKWHEELVKNESLKSLSQENEMD